jgi:hypothetical protein
MNTKPRESISGSSIRASAERAAEARKKADGLACEVWNQRMIGYKGPAQPSPALGDTLNARYRCGDWIARRFAAIHTSAATSWHCCRTRFQPANRSRHGARVIVGDTLEVNGMRLSAPAWTWYRS